MRSGIPGRGPGTAGAVLAAGLVLAACASGTIANLPPPPTTIEPAATTSIPDGGGGSLQGVSGATTTTSTPLGPGTSSLSGTVSGPNGPVAGAVVQVQRITSATAPPATDRLATSASGTWSLADVLGGVYRIRAWKSPDLAATQPVSFFLSAGESHQVQIQLQAYAGQSISTSLAPDPPMVGQPAELVVEVTDTAVDGAGVVRAQPVVGAVVALDGSSEWEINSANPVTSDGGGEAAWEITCLASGPQSLSVIVDGAPPQPISPLSPCSAPPSTTTSSPSTTATTTSPTSSPKSSTTLSPKSSTSSP